MKIEEQKDYVLAKLAGSKVIFTKRNKFNFSRFLEMNEETIKSFLNLEELFEREKEKRQCMMYVPNAEHTNLIVVLEECMYYKMVQYNNITLKMPKPLCDGIITTDNSKSLIVFPGDCIVVAGIDKASGTRFILHAGWRGVSLEIAKEMTIKLKKMNVKVEDMELIIFPSISKEFFELDFENAKVFSDYKNFVRENNTLKKCNIDIVGILKSQLIKEGFCEKNISEMDYCTYSSYDTELDEYKFNSYRRDKSIHRNAAILLGEYI